ncbi:MAG TPA: response regulator [Microvirga sp.]|nr:response regulator [Microvirga sp.]
MHEQLILNVDDDEAGRYARTRLLRQAGLSVIEASTGEEALRRVASERPSLVLLDVRLPDMDGFEVCRLVKADRPGTLVVQVSASFTSDADRVRGLSGGADGFLFAPIDPAVLVATVRAFLRLQSTIFDLARQNASLEAAESAEARYRLLAENSTDMIGRMTVDGRRLYVSPACRDVLGFEPEELIGEEITVAVHPDDVDAVKAGLQQLLSSPTGQQTVTYRVWHKQGRWVTIESRRRLIRDAQGRPTEFVSVGRDITERLQLEEQLRQAQKMEAMGQLTGGVAHDFNNLLTVILGNAEILTEHPTDPALTYSLACQILETAERGADLNQKLLSFARRRPLNPERLDVDRIIEGMVPLLSRTIGEHIELKTDLGSGSLTALADRSQLESAVLNLAVNARDAMPKGGTLTIGVKERTALPGEGTLPIGHDVIAITVSDTGTGMPPEILARVFEPFFTTKEVGKGTGLGLPMVYGFARQSGGHTTIHSVPGRGTTVSILLLAVSAAATAAQPREARPAPQGRERVLVVEDEPQVLRFVSAQLASLGYEVTAVPVARDALDLLEAGKSFELLFSDVVLPQGMSGVELAERAREIQPTLKVLLTSGYPAEAFEQHGRPRPDTPLLHKPYRRKELGEALRKVLVG